ncbi:hypothetical protein [Arthrobacter sp. StoSoilA2]|uniref:hypothetical protein n=1 Tax=Arthrobacter sp. StoSoilA2 TaxID=2830990 RepID=UPI0021E19928|nr:hypothetical protein [Arthrobacter sp. StoSoilA2]
MQAIAVGFELLDLHGAAEAVGEDGNVGSRFGQCRYQSLFSDLHGDVLVVGFEAEVPGDAAAARGFVDVGDTKSSQGLALHGGTEGGVFATVGLHGRGRRHGRGSPAAVDPFLHGFGEAADLVGTRWAASVPSSSGASFFNAAAQLGLMTTIGVSVPSSSFATALPMSGVQLAGGDLHQSATGVGCTADGAAGAFHHPGRCPGHLRPEALSERK